MAPRRCCARRSPSQMPDVTFQGLNRIRVLVDKNIPAELDGYIAAEKDFDKPGLSPGDVRHRHLRAARSMRCRSRSRLPIVYVNVDLVKQGGRRSGQPAEDVGRADRSAKKIKALGPDINGITYAWDITGNWLWQAPVFSRGGTMLNADETKVAFNGPEAAVRDSRRWRVSSREAGMPNLDQPAMRATFAAGKTGISHHLDLRPQQDDAR